MEAIFIHGQKDLRIYECTTPVLESNSVKIKISRGGICGSDLHYFNHGKVGFSKIREPMVLGHEVSGIIVDIGSNVENLKIGDLISINPASNCRKCIFCKNNRSNHCISMKFFGSALLFPHIQGAFRQEIVVDARQCYKMNSTSPDLAALVEPLSVVLHAVKKAGKIKNKKVLITGSGPIGLITAAICKKYKAKQVVVTDLEDFPLSIAKKLKIDNAINMNKKPNNLKAHANDLDLFDVMFECSASDVAFRSGIDVLSPGSKLIQLGLTSEFTIPIMQLASKEIEIIGSWRFCDEFEEASNLINNGYLDLSPLISHNVYYKNAVEAFITASKRNQSMKVQLNF